MVSYGRLARIHGNPNLTNAVQFSFVEQGASKLEKKRQNLFRSFVNNNGNIGYLLPCAANKPKKDDCR